uniref:Allophanate hydrolase C-terminal domain-containing protein n=1 Tax=Tetradesmus obliquus TaxID=3088 RepID=A0A383W6A3_TETOB|eukprot:jgi/Sobl393_1/14422/SZX77136.1
MFQLAVAGAHLTGLPLNYQLTELGAKLVKTVRTAPVYKMYSLGPKPALIRQPEGTPGGSLELELWEMPIEKVGFFLRDGVKEPLGIGDVLLEEGSVVKGFIGEAYAVAAAPDITHHGGWRAYLAASQK